MKQQLPKIICCTNFEKQVTNKKSQPQFYRICSLVFIFFLLVTGMQSFSQVGTWTAVTAPCPGAGGGAMLLLSDGTAMVKTFTGGGDGIGNTWYRLVPDASGSYINGSWALVKPMKNTRLYFSSQVLKDGRVYVAGGEYGTGGFDAETYDPLTNKWTDAPAPGGHISDANSEILENGHVVQALVTGDLRPTKNFDPGSNTYSASPSCLGIHNESAWLKLPDNSILFVDRVTTSSERYIPASNTWIADGTVPVDLYDPYGDETGGAVLLPDGRGFFVGSLGHTAYYTPSGTTAPGTWTAGPDVPDGQGQPDAPVAMMVNGKILLAVSPAPTSGNHFPSPTAFYEFDYLTNTYTKLKAPGGGKSLATSSYIYTFLDLPDGNVLLCTQGSSTFYVYTPSGSPLSAGKPKIKSVTLNSPGVYTIKGKQFNGISEGASYGDDWQMASNYPIVRLTAAGVVYYCRTSDWNSTGVMRGSQKDKAKFTLPAGLPSGTYSLVVVANGIASNPVSLSTEPAPFADISYKQAGDNTAKIYPNPATDKTTLHFTLDKGQHVSIKIFSETGKQMQSIADQSMQKGEHTLAINTSTYAKGVYFVKIITESGTTNVKLAVQ